MSDNPAKWQGVGFTHGVRDADTERRAIVAWLREREAAGNTGFLGIPHWAYREIANRIERGEHLKDTPWPT
jgi:hypothetical protein